MKTKKLFKWASFFIISAAVLFSSCKEEENRITAQDTQDLTEEALTDSYFQDMDDMAGVAIQSDDATNGGRVAAGGRSITIQDDRFDCEGIVISIEELEGSTAEIPKGKITVDFGSAGCEDLRGNVRTGKLIFTYTGKRFQHESSIVTTSENYTINDVKLEGTRTLINETESTSDAPVFKVTLVGGEATFEDGSTATRESTIISTWIRAANPSEDKLIIDQSSTASGETRGGRSYAISLLEPLEFKRYCGVAVSGIKKYVIDGEKEIIIDYGDGTCDKSFTVTVNGVTRSISAN